MKLHQCLVITLYTLILAFSSNVYAQESDTKSEHNSAEEQSVDVETPYVEVYRDVDVFANYKDRRDNSGVLFSIDYHNLLPKSYLSTLDNSSFTDVYGENGVPMFEMQLAYKYNFSMGAIAIGAGYAMGTQTGVESNGKDATITITKPFLSATYIMDNIYEEPYIAPYGQVQMWQLGVQESSESNSFSGSTELGFSYAGGLLIQLNSIDADTARTSIKTMGLENTYLDLYAIKYMKSQSANDADTESELTWGAGLKLEF